jgi:hypothetical protein
MATALDLGPERFFEMYVEVFTRTLWEKSQCQNQKCSVPTPTALAKT